MKLLLSKFEIIIFLENSCILQLGLISKLIGNLVENMLQENLSENP